jgi:hypothetical protein
MSVFFFLNQNDVVLVIKKRKTKTKVNGFATGSCRVNPPGQLGHTGFFLPLFFLQPGPIPAPGRAGFQNYKNY